MIPRYSRPEMSAIWTDENKLRKWLEAEVAFCAILAEEGRIPKEDFAEIESKADFNVDDVLELEKELKHDVIAFLTNVAQHVGPSSRFIHLGLTSSDVLDTGLALQTMQASELIEKKLQTCLETIKEKAYQYKKTVCIGRSHGIHAEPVTFGLKLALLYDEMKRAVKRFHDGKEEMRYGQFSGAVGTFAHNPPHFEEKACARLNLKPAPISTQIILRDRHAAFLNGLAFIASVIERFSIELRHLQRTEVLEVEESFGAGQKGSSAMPHKKNPITGEQLSGIARLVRSNASLSFENIPLWHERDISHSSVERVIFPDSTIAVDYMLARFNGLIKNLVVHEKNMIKNLEITGGLYNSQTILLLLAEEGAMREDAYRWVQRNAMKAWESGKNLQEYLEEDEDILKYLDVETIRNACSIEKHTGQVDAIFERVFERDNYPFAS